MDHVIILSGLSGSGKSTTVKYLEDLGFFCIDNLPPKLIYTFIDLCNTSFEDIKKVAIVLDIRVPDKDILNNFEDIFKNIKEKTELFDLIFLECSEEAIIKRYKETMNSLNAMKSSVYLNINVYFMQMYLKINFQALY